MKRGGYIEPTHRTKFCSFACNTLHASLEQPLRNVFILVDSDQQTGSMEGAIEGSPTARTCYLPSAQPLFPCGTLEVRRVARISLH